MKTWPCIAGYLGDFQQPTKVPSPEQVWSLSSVYQQCPDWGFSTPAHSVECCWGFLLLGLSDFIEGDAPDPVKSPHSTRKRPDRCALV